MDQEPAGRSEAINLDAASNRFDDEWQRGGVASIANYYASLFPEGFHDSTLSLRRELLSELITIDLEHRWRGEGDSRTKRADSDPLPPRPTLEDYLNLFPELGGVDELPEQLIIEEFRIRHRWGDAPEYDEYLERFGLERSSLLDAIHQAHVSMLLATGQHVPGEPPQPEPEPATMALIMKGVSPQAWSYPVTSKPIVIGRDEDADIRFANRLVSRRHCSIHQKDEGVFLQDEGSRNGTYVNHKRVESCRLEPRDTILVGAFELTLAEISKLGGGGLERTIERNAFLEQPASILLPKSPQRRLAAAIYQRLNPPRQITLPNLLVEVSYLSSGKLGGDIFECVEMDDRWMLAIFDSMTHGTASALVGMLLRSELGRWAPLTESPSECLRRVNAELVGLDVDDEVGQIYVSARLIVWHPKQQMMVMSSAGLGHPIVIRKGAPLELEDHAGGMPLGISPDVNYSEKLVELEKGDRVFLFSNGVVEPLIRRAGKNKVSVIHRHFCKKAYGNLKEHMDSILGHIEGEVEDDAVLVGCEIQGV